MFRTLASRSGVRLSDKELRYGFARAVLVDRCATREGSRHEHVALWEALDVEGIDGHVAGGRFNGLEVDVLDRRFRSNEIELHAAPNGPSLRATAVRTTFLVVEPSVITASARLRSFTDDAVKDAAHSRGHVSPCT